MISPTEHCRWCGAWLADHEIRIKHHPDESPESPYELICPKTATL